MVKIGLVAFASNSGLGNQTRRLAELINPDRILVIDSSPFSINRVQNMGWYEKYNYFTSSGFPSNDDVKKFLVNLTHIFTCENPYNFNLIYWAHKQGAKTYVQSNYEFCENLDKPYLPVPTKFLMPSYWKLEEMQELFGKDTVMYLPPPMDNMVFEKNRSKNLKRSGKRRFLHVIGTAAHKDRNGTFDLLDAVKLSKSDFELIITSQHPLPVSCFLDDLRVRYMIDDVKNEADLYNDFDALILPRRYGGLSLTCNEALMSALPVIMTDISPNNQLLLKNWLVESEKKEIFHGRSEIELYSAIPQLLADKIDEFCRIDLHSEKLAAAEIGYQSFDNVVLRDEYKKLWI